MFATTLTARPATRVKSGPPPENPTGCATDWEAAVAARGCRSAARADRSNALDSAAVRQRPVTTRPATNPATISISDRVMRRNMAGASADVDAPRAAIARLRDRD